MVSSPLADFLSRLQEDKTLSTNVAVVSDNARGRAVVAHTVYSQKLAKRSRWGPGKEKSKRSPEVPVRGLSPYQEKSKRSPEVPVRGLSPYQEKSKRSPEVPVRGLSPYLPTVYICKQRIDVTFPALSSLKDHLLDE
jgi:hypothetical protein